MSGTEPSERGRPGELGAAIDAQLRAIYEALPIGVGFVTADLRYEYVNEALAQMNGVPVEQHLGRTVGEVLGEHAAEAEQHTREVIRRREPVEVEFVLRTPASPNEQRWFLATYFPVFEAVETGADEQEVKLLGVGAVVRDVTDRHAHRRELERLLSESLTTRAQAQAAQVRAEAAREETVAALAEARAQREVAAEAVRRATFLATVTQQMAASLDYRATLRELLASAVPYLADWGLVTAAEPDGHFHMVGFAHTDPAGAQLGEELARQYLPGRGSSLAGVISSGEPVLAQDLSHEQMAAIASEGETEFLRRLEVRHFGTWPISSPDGAVIGTLTFGYSDSGRRFSPAALETAEVVAARAGLHLTNARLYSERSEVARTLQASLLPPQLPQVPGIELASAFVAAGSGNVVGGDFFDVFRSGDGVWTAIVGDVMGKGAQAAAVTATARHTLRAAALIDPDPAKNLALLNRVLLAEGNGRLCTAVYARLCPGERQLKVRLAHAGHPPALIMRQDGSAQFVAGGRGPLLGAVPHGRFGETELVLAVGETLVLYTDGVTEARPYDTELSEQTLVATLTSYAHHPAAVVAEAIKSTALQLQGNAPRDDIAVLVVRVLSNDLEASRD